MAVAFHPDEEYVALESGGEVYIVASKLAKDAAEKCRLSNPRELAHFPGRKLERLDFQHPFLDRKVLGVLADYVTMDTGTGVVHTAPSHGAEDFATGVKYGLDATSTVSYTHLDVYKRQTGTNAAARTHSIRSHGRQVREGIAKVGHVGLR